jgi:hypothetical protein
MASSKAPPPQYPFPRALTKKITGPEYKDGMTFDEARAAWYGYLRIVHNLKQMTLPHGHKKRD